MPGHDLTRFYPLLTLIAVLAILQPHAADAVLTALGLLSSLHQLR
jgi:hypothetical protein